MYNIIDEKFIPTTSGFQSLSSLFTNAHIIEAIECNSPLTTLALHRFLLPFLYRSHGIKTSKEWAELWKLGKFPEKPMQEYFEKWHDKFELIGGETPFYQSIDLKNEPEGSLNRLRFITSNDASLFCKEFEGEKTSREFWQVALDLLTYQLMSVHSGKGLKEPVSCFHESARRGMAILLIGKNIFETLMLNCLPYELSGVISSGLDAPAWETNYAKSDYCNGYMHFLTQPSRKVKLQITNEGQIEFTAEAGDDPFQGIQDPFVIYQNTIEKKKQVRKSLKFAETKYLWRNFHIMCISAKTNAAQENESFTFANNTNLSRVADITDEDIQFTYHCFGMFTDTKLTKYKAIIQEKLTLRLATIINDNEADKISQIVVRAESIGSLLQKRLFVFFKKMGVQDTSDLEIYKRRFWVSANAAFQNLLGNFSDKREEAIELFLKTMKREAESIFLEATRRLQDAKPEKYFDFMFRNGGKKHLEKGLGEIE